MNEAYHQDPTGHSFLPGLVYQTCVGQKCKIILFCDWPTTAWLVEILMLLLGFSVVTIRAKHKWNEREQVVREFNDRTSTVQVLVTSVKISSTSINLQKDCCCVCFVDVPSNAQSVQHTQWGRPSLSHSFTTSTYLTACATLPI